ncbi:NTP transferase domain-containing protein [Candidatus Uhrbacteria bacterium]|nr:NTP transferase domain-containing protein [Candidatus Uhrbacteria bacterium]
MLPAKTAVIMAAGLGTRMRPLTDDTPKPLLPVLGRPILEWNIESLPAEITEVVLVVSYLAEKIRAHFGDSWGGRAIRYVEQPDLKGTGMALAACAPLLAGRFVVMNGDDLYAREDIEAALKHELAILAKPAEGPGRFGAFKVDAAGNLVDIVEGGETGPGSLINIGLYVLDRRVFDYPPVPIKDGAEFGLPQQVALMAKDHRVAILKAGFWVPIGYPEDLAKAESLLKKKLGP